MRLETSFTHEAENARKCAQLLAQTPELRDDIYIPRVFGKDEGCRESDRVMVMEWVDGCRYVMYQRSHDSSGSILLLLMQYRQHRISVLIEPTADTYRLNDTETISSLNLSPRSIMDLAISLNSAMTFTWGFVHCDPHPGNILVRQHPDPKKKRRNQPQIVLIDHGLYIPLEKGFREEYCTLWRSLFVLDVGKIEEIARKWGIAVDANM
jgi:aarF domain-containing kinase